MQTSEKNAVLEKVTPLNEGQLEDLSLQSHRLEIGSHSVTLDGHEVSIRAMAKSLYWMVKASDPTTIVTTPEALWFALAGKETQPSAAEAGFFLAENLARWQEQQRLHQVVAEMMPLGVPALPQPRLDPFIEAALQRLSHEPSREKIVALAQVLDLPVENVVSLLQQRGLGAECQTSGDEPWQGEEAAAPGVIVEQLEDLAEGTSPFRWTQELERILTEAYWASPPEQSTFACAKDIARRYGWPVSRVDYKIRALKLPERRAEKSSERKEDASSDGDQEGD